jgi:hypothetical protein
VEGRSGWRTPRKERSRAQEEGVRRIICSRIWTSVPSHPVTTCHAAAAACPRCWTGVTSTAAAAIFVRVEVEMKDIAVRCLSLIFASGKYLFYYVTTLYHYEFTNFLSNVHEMAKILVGDK